MATEKTWTAHDLKMGTLKLNIIDGQLSATHGYSFEDSSGDIIEELPMRVITENKLFSSLPANIRTGLIDLVHYMYERALTQEGME